MRLRSLSIAMLAGNPALAGILQRALRDDGGHEVASFVGIEALTTFLRISPIDVVLLDTDLPGSPVVDIAKGLRQHLRLASPDFRIIALTRTPTPFHRPLRDAGIDRVLVKPVTPGQVLETVEAMFQPLRAVALAASQPHLPAASSTASPARIGNVIPLFGEGRTRR